MERSTSPDARDERIHRTDRCQRRKWCCVLRHIQSGSILSGRPESGSASGGARGGGGTRRAGHDSGAKIGQNRLARDQIVARRRPCRMRTFQARNSCAQRHPAPHRTGHTGTDHRHGTTARSHGRAAEPIRQHRRDGRGKPALLHDSGPARARRSPHPGRAVRRKTKACRGHRAAWATRRPGHRAAQRIHDRQGSRRVRARVRTRLRHQADRNGTVDIGEEDQELAEQYDI